MITDNVNNQDHPGLDEPDPGQDPAPTSLVTGNHKVLVDYAAPRDWVKTGKAYPSPRTVSVTAERLNENGEWEPLVQSAYAITMEDPAQDQTAFTAIMFSGVGSTTLELVQGRTWRLTAPGGGVILANSARNATDKLLGVVLRLAGNAIADMEPPARVTTSAFTVPDNPRTTADYYSHVAPEDKYAWLGEDRG